MGILDYLDSKEPENRCVVRISESMWRDEKGIYEKKSIKFLKRKSMGFNVLDEDASQIGAEYIIPKIINLHTCKPGIYEVVTCNEKRDRESGLVDEYDYKLVIFEE